MSDSPATRAVARRGIVVGAACGDGVRDNTHRASQQATVRSAITRISDLLTDEERASLYADLAEIARCRRRAEAASRDIVLP